MGNVTFNKKKSLSLISSGPPHELHPTGDVTPALEDSKVPGSALSQLIAGATLRKAAFPIRRPSSRFCAVQDDDREVEDKVTLITDVEHLKANTSYCNSLYNIGFFHQTGILIRAEVRKDNQVISNHR